MCAVSHPPSSNPNLQAVHRRSTQPDRYVWLELLLLLPIIGLLLVILLSHMLCVLVVIRIAMFTPLRVQDHSQHSLATYRGPKNPECLQ